MGKQRISDLLSRISETFPHLIIFPAVVGSLTTGSSTSQTLTNIFAGTVGLEEEGEEQKRQEDSGRLEMASAHSRIVEVLQKKSHLSIEEVCI